MRDQMQTDVLEYLDKRFGLSEDTFKRYRLYLASKGRIYLGPKWIPDDRKVVTVGLLVARVAGGIKPTTNLFQAFGRQITKNFIELGREDTITYAKGQDLLIKDPHEATEGYVLLRYKDTQLGCGLLKGKTLKNMLPKAKRLEIRFL